MPNQSLIEAGFNAILLLDASDALNELMLAQNSAASIPIGTELCKEVHFCPRIPLRITAGSNRSHKLGKREGADSVAVAATIINLAQLFVGERDTSTHSSALLSDSYK